MDRLIAKCPFHMSKTYHIWTIGCQMNAADSRAGAELFVAAGRLIEVAGPPKGERGRRRR